jgi:hypothetical protein
MYVSDSLRTVVPFMVVVPRTAGDLDCPDPSATIDVPTSTGRAPRQRIETLDPGRRVDGFDPKEDERMTLAQIRQKYDAWTRSKHEQWVKAWAFADAVLEYAEEKPRGYADEIATATGLTRKYISEIRMTAAAYSGSSRNNRNPNTSFRAHMEWVSKGRGGEPIPDGTRLRDVSPGTDDAVVERMVRERPEVVARALTKEPTVAASITEHLTEELPQARAAAARGTQKNLDRREAEGRRKEREVVGDETIDDLEYSQALRDGEMDLIKARGWLISFLRRTTEEIEDSPDSWKESCYRWLDEIEGSTAMARAYLDGGDIDDGLRKLLAEEGR